MDECKPLVLGDTLAKIAREKAGPGHSFLWNHPREWEPKVRNHPREWEHKVRNHPREWEHQVRTSQRSGSRRCETTQGSGATGGKSPKGVEQQV